MCAIFNSVAVALLYFHIIFAFSLMNCAPAHLSQLNQRIALATCDTNLPLPTSFEFSAFSLLQILILIIWLVYFQFLFFSLFHAFDVIDSWVLGYIPKFKSSIKSLVNFHRVQRGISPSPEY